MERKDALSEILRLDERVITIEWPTGFGKTYGSLQKAKHLKANKILVLCDQRSHILNWKEEVKKHKLQSLNIDYACYASIYKYQNTTYDCVIADEGHHITDNRMYSLKQINFKNLLVLSATLHKEVVDRLINEYGKKNFYRHIVTISEAIDANVLPTPKIIIVKKYLDSVDKKHDYKGKLVSDKVFYQKLTNSVNSKQRIYYNNYEPWAKNAWMQAALKRKRWIADSKTEDALRILTTELSDKKTVVFCGSVKQAEYLQRKIINRTSITIHSKTKKWEKELDKFNDSSKGILFVVGMFRENANFTGIEAGLCIQLDNNALSFIQMLGRAMRSKHPLFYIILSVDTQDNTYFQKVLENTNKEHIVYK